jgi:hypothetical protein
MNKINNDVSYHNWYKLNSYENTIQDKRYSPGTTNQIHNTFEQIYALLVRFSEKIQIIQDLVFNITEKIKVPISETWNYFNHFFLEGAYFHYRCQGYVECLRITGAFSSNNINIWVNQLVYPAAENFKYSMMYFNQLKQNPDITQMPEFSLLKKQLEEFKNVAMVIIEYANRLNTISSPIII